LNFANQDYTNELNFENFLKISPAFTSQFKITNNLLRVPQLPLDVFFEKNTQFVNETQAKSLPFATGIENGFNAIKSAN